MPRLPESKRAAIAADLRCGSMTQAQIAANHSISERTVRTIKSGLKPADPQDATLARLDRLAAAAEKTLALAEHSNDGKRLAEAIRAAHTALASVAKMRADIQREAEGGTRADLEAVKAAVVDELKGLPDVRRRVAARLSGLGR